MEDFGTVDLVVADIGAQGLVRSFVSVELQAVDITGSVEPAYQALTSNSMITNKFSYGVNWANVRKRYISQLISKGFFHHHWGSKIISILQAPLYKHFRSYIPFDELDPKSESSNVVFMLYDFCTVSAEDPARNQLRFVKAVGTSHNSLMTSALYRTPPDRSVFCQKILDRLSPR